jgi:hypothetical protein
MMMFFFWFLYIWMFIAVFSDIFRRRDLSGWAKAGWTLFVLVLPILGILIYMATRPKPTEEELAEMTRYAAPTPRYSAADEISKLAELREKGAISDEEFAALKSKAVA